MEPTNTTTTDTNDSDIQQDELEKIDNFFSQFQKPNNLSEIRNRTEQFCRQNQHLNIVLVTSGGTTVPMELNTVRFVDNFSAGTRGAASTEYFFETRKYAIIFFYRTKSLEPYNRHFDSLLNHLHYDEQNDSFQADAEIKPKLVSTLKKMTDISSRLLKITFTTLAEYLFTLRELCSVLKPYGPKVMLYLAAAVSDFYIPPQNLSVHKIQSNEPLSLHLEMVPKILRPLVKFWIPDAFVISFKLETDENILLVKARRALKQYGHKLVIANELNTRKWRVTLVTENESETIEIDRENAKIEIEELIVSNVTKRHEIFIGSDKK